MARGPPCTDSTDGEIREGARAAPGQRSEPESKESGGRQWQRAWQSRRRCGFRGTIVACRKVPECEDQTRSSAQREAGSHGDDSNGFIPSGRRVSEQRDWPGLYFHRDMGREWMDTEVRTPLLLRHRTSSPLPLRQNMPPPIEYSRSMPASSRHDRGMPLQTRGGRDVSPLQRCNREESPPPRHVEARCRLQCLSMVVGECCQCLLMEMVKREGRTAPPELGQGADVAQGLTNEMNAITNQVVQNSGWLYLDGTYKEYPVFKRKFRSYQANYHQAISWSRCSGRCVCRTRLRCVSRKWRQ